MINSLPNLGEMTVGLGLSSILFAGYSEMKTGNVWIRTSENGDRKISARRLLKFMASPLWKKDLWRPELLHQNFLVFTLATTPVLASLYKGFY